MPQQALELLALCDRKITLARPAWCKVFYRVRTPVSSIPQTIGEHIHWKRKTLGLHQWQLAGFLKVCRSMLGSWESNHYEPEGLVRGRVITWLGFDPQKRAAENPTADLTSNIVGYLDAVDQL